MSSPTSTEQFDGFYASTRRRILLQAFALTGDLGAARAGVREAFTAAAHHWRKVSRLPRPEDWVRPRAWAGAQRRSRGRPFHRERDLSEAQQGVLDALRRLPDPQRRVVLLTHLAALSLQDIATEVGQTRERTSRLLQQGTAALSLSLGCDSALVRVEIERLAPVVARPGLPRASIVSRAGRRRRRRHALGAAALGVALVLGTGLLVVDRSPSAPAAAVDVHPVTRTMLVDAGMAARLAPHRHWRVLRTGHNTRGDGLNTPCQRARFADRHGAAALVRTLRAHGGGRLVQSIEVSDSPATAQHTYRTTLGWYAGCTAPQVHLVDAYRVGGVGDQARILRLRFGADQPRASVVAIARQGALTQSLVLQAPGHDLRRPAPLARLLSHAMRRLCPSSAVGGCSPPDRVTVHPTLPPASGEPAGMLATDDLPVVPRVDEAWVGTDAHRGGRNLAQTTCDRADFTGAGATMRTRSFLIPQADLPERFGITESYGRFPDAAGARAFLDRVRHRLATCEDRELGTKVRARHDPRGRDAGDAAPDYSLWRVTSEISERRSVTYWMGVVRVGRYVAQVSFAPAPHADVPAPALADLLVRAGDRLSELPGTP